MSLTRVPSRRRSRNSFIKPHHRSSSSIVVLVFPQWCGPKKSSSSRVIEIATSESEIPSTHQTSKHAHSNQPSQPEFRRGLFDSSIHFLCEDRSHTNAADVLNSAPHQLSSLRVCSSVVILMSQGNIFENF